MNTVQLDIRQLQAARHAAAKSDIRYYLNGIYVEAGKGVTRVVSTNGHIMYVHDYKHGLDQWEGTFIIPNDTIEMFVKAGKHSNYAMQIEVELLRAKNMDTPFNHYRLKLQHGDKVVECRNIGGVFPDCARVIPVQMPGASWTIHNSSERDERGLLPNELRSGAGDRITIPEHLGTYLFEQLNSKPASHFNLDYIAVWRKVQDVFTKKSNPTIHHNGPTSTAAVTFRHLPNDQSAIGAMMPIRDETTYPDTTPFRARLAITEVVEVNSTDTHDPESK